MESFSTIAEETIASTSQDRSGGVKARRTLKNVLSETLKGSKKIQRKIENKIGLRKPKKKISGSPWRMIPSRKVRKDKINDDQRKEITDFFMSGEVTREVPNRKEVSNKTNMGKMIMTMPIKEAFAIYKRKFPTRKVDFTAFYKLKPSNIKKVSETNRRCCLCQLCCNVALLVEAANKFETENTESKGNLTKQSAGDITVCKYDGEYPKAECMRRDCQKCSASAIIYDYKKWKNILVAQSPGYILGANH